MESTNHSKKNKKSSIRAKKIAEDGVEAGMEGIQEGVEVAGKGAEVLGKSVEMAGKGVQMAGKGVEFAGKGVEVTGQIIEKKTQEGVKIVVRFVKKRRNIKDYFSFSRSGTITGAADNDPAGIITYTQVGALTGTTLLWLPIITYPMLVVTEEMSARIGVVAKKGLNKVIAENFGQKIALLMALILILANTLTIGADIAGMGQLLGI